MQRPKSLSILLLNPDNYSFRAFLEKADKLVAIKNTTNDGDVTRMEEFARVFLTKFEADLIARKNEWHDLGKKELAYVVSQLEAIAYLTGLKSKLFDSDAVPYIRDTFKLPDLNKYIDNNFLHRKTDLKFTQFNRSLLTLQLLVRVADYKKIQQREEEVCGPAAFMYSVASNNGLEYVKHVCELAEFGRSGIAMAKQGEGNGLQIEIKDEKSFSQPSRFEQVRKISSEEIDDIIHEVDFISLVGLRAYYNLIVGYGRGSQAFGVTLPNEIKGWMKQAGFEHIDQFALKNKEDIKHCEKLLGYGYSLVYLTTVNATRQVLEKAKPVSYEESEDHSRIRQLMDGHFIQVKSLRYVDDSDSVELGIVSWGEAPRIVTLKLAELTAMSGLSQVIVGQSPQAKWKQKASARYNTSDRRIHPYFYCNVMIKGIIETDRNGLIAQKFSTEDQAKVNELETFIKRNLDRLQYQNWTLAAKELQEKIYQFIVDNNYAEPFHSWLMNCVEYSIIDECLIEIDSEDENGNEHKQTLHPVNLALRELLAPNLSADGNDSASLGRMAFAKFNLSLLAKHGVTQDEIGEKLHKMVVSRDIDALRLVIEYCVFRGHYEEACKWLEKARSMTWLNSYDKHVCDEAFACALRNEAYDLLQRDEVDVADLSSLQACVSKIGNKGHRNAVQAAFGLLAHKNKHLFQTLSIDVQQDLKNINKYTQEYVACAEIARLQLYHMQTLLFALNDINKSLYPNDYQKKFITKLKVKFNEQVQEYYNLIKKDDKESLIEELKICRKEVAKLYVDIFTTLDFSGVKDKFNSLINKGQHENASETSFASFVKNLDLHLAALTNQSLCEFSKRVSKEERPALLIEEEKMKNLPDSVMDEENFKAFNTHYNLHKMHCHVVEYFADQTELVDGRVLGSLAGSVAGVFAGIGVGAYLIPLLFGLTLATMPMIGIILAGSILLAVAGYAIGAYIDSQQQKLLPPVQVDTRVTLPLDNNMGRFELAKPDLRQFGEKQKVEFPSLRTSSSFHQPANSSSQAPKNPQASSALRASGSF